MKPARPSSNLHFHVRQFMSVAHPSAAPFDNARRGVSVGAEIRAWSVERLDWDSRTFGFAIGKLVHRAGSDSDSSCAGWQEALAAARLDRLQLVYGDADPEVLPEPALLDEFGGSRVADAVLYAGDVTELARGGDAANGGVTPLISSVEELPPDAPCDADLMRLSFAAGAHSRFCVDPRFPRAGFERLYRTWIERSVRREIADKVFVWRGDGRIRGLVTTDVRAGTGRIGLLAVDESIRGRGVGGGLVRAAARWMAEIGATRCEVGTQRGNGAACAFYERVGFNAASVRATYHFWLDSA